MLETLAAPVVTHRETSSHRWLKFAAMVALIVGLILIARATGLRLSDLSPDRIRNFVLSFGKWAPAVYLIAYGQPLIPLPASILTLSAGVAFGTGWGSLAALAGATIRACGQFALARALGREAVSGLLRGRLEQLDHKLGDSGFRTVFLVRLIPNFPFDVQNYLFGFSRVHAGPYILGTVLGITPGIFLYVYLGYSLVDPKEWWKLGLAICLLIALFLAQRLWKARAATTRVPLDGVATSA